MMTATEHSNLANVIASCRHTHRVFVRMPAGFWYGVGGLLSQSSAEFQVEYMGGNGVVAVTLRDPEYRLSDEEIQRACDAIVNAPEVL